MTLLENDVAPLWVWILVIALGSLLIILILTLGLWCRRRRNSRKAKLDLETSTTSEKRLTIQEGKCVPRKSLQSLASERCGQLTTEDLISSPDLRLNSRYQSPLTEQQMSLQGEYIQRSDSRSNYDEYDRAESSQSTYAKGATSDIGSVSEVSTISKPLLAVTVDSQKANTVNFSRPQLRKSASVRPSGRLSVIRESTPRSSWYSRISRIMSMASSDRDEEIHEPLPQRPEVPRVSEKAPQVSLNLSFEKAAVDEQVNREPLHEVMEEFQRLSGSTSPEPAVRHPSGITYRSDDPTVYGHSRANSSGNAARKTGNSHKYNISNASTNMTRKPAQSTNSRSSSVVNFSRKPYSPEEERPPTAVSSWAEAPKATLSEPFDSPALVVRESGASLWSYETYQTPSNQSHRYTANTLSSVAFSPTSTTTNSIVMSPASHHRSLTSPQLKNVASPVPETSVQAQYPQHMTATIVRANSDPRGRDATWFDDASSPGGSIVRGRSEGRKGHGRGPRRVRSKSSGRNVLQKKRSSHQQHQQQAQQAQQQQKTEKQGKQQHERPKQPEIRLIGSVDPSSLENLSVIDP